MNNSKMFRAWITKYALTTGVKTAMGNVHPTFDNVLEVSRDYGRAIYHGEGRDWHRTRESAVARVEEMRKAAFRAAKRKLDKLSTMRIEVPE